MIFKKILKFSLCEIEMFPHGNLKCPRRNCVGIFIFGYLRFCEAKAFQDCEAIISITAGEFQAHGVSISRSLIFQGAFSHYQTIKGAANMLFSQKML